MKFDKDMEGLFLIYNKSKNYYILVYQNENAMNLINLKCDPSEQIEKLIAQGYNKAQIYMMITN